MKPALLVAENGGAVEKPRNWHKWLLAAHVRRMGGTQAEAASAAGVHEKTVWNWEHREELWALARYESAELWAREVDDAARLRILKAIRDEGDTDSAWRWLERTDDRLAPATRRVEMDHRVQLVALLEGLPPERLAEISRMSDDQIIELLGDGELDAA